MFNIFKKKTKLDDYTCLSNCIEANDKDTFNEWLKSIVTNDVLGQRFPKRIYKVKVTFKKRTVSPKDAIDLCFIFNRVQMLKMIFMQFQLLAKKRAKHKSDIDIPLEYSQYEHDDYYGELSAHYEFEYLTESIKYLITHTINVNKLSMLLAVHRILRHENDIDLRIFEILNNSYVNNLTVYQFKRLRHINSSIQPNLEWLGIAVMGRNSELTDYLLSFEHIRNAEIEVECIQCIGDNPKSYKYVANFNQIYETMTDDTVRTKVDYEHRIYETTIKQICDEGVLYEVVWNYRRQRHGYFP